MSGWVHTFQGGLAVGLGVSLPTLLIAARLKVAGLLSVREFWAVSATICLLIGAVLALVVRSPGAVMFIIDGLVNLARWWKSDDDDDGQGRRRRDSVRKVTLRVFGPGLVPAALGGAA